jgi:hypothetical protein
MAKHQWVIGADAKQYTARCRACGLRRRMVAPVVVPQRAEVRQSVRPFAVYAVPRGTIWSTFQPGCVAG